MAWQSINSSHPTTDLKSKLFRRGLIILLIDKLKVGRPGSARELCCEGRDPDRCRCRPRGPSRPRRGAHSARRARLLVEGGAGLAAAFFRTRLVDRLVWVHAPLAIGGDGIPAIGGLDLAALSDAPAFERLSTETIGDDVLTTFRVRPL